MCGENNIAAAYVLAEIRLTKILLVELIVFFFDSSMQVY